MFAIYLVILAIITKDCSSQDEGEGPHRGKFIGKLNSYHHQVSGDVYAVDDWTLLLVNFNYDGTGDDTFFWAGDSGRPGPQGFIVADEHGKTNVLERYFDAEFRLNLPEGKRVSRIKWFAVYDIATQNAFGDVYIADEFEAPAARALGPLTGAGTVTSHSVMVLDAKTILIPSLYYDGKGGEVYFWCGVGPQPSRKGFQIPDEYGYLEPISMYNNTDVRLTLPGELTVFSISWLCLWGADSSLASVLIPEGLNVPPAATSTRSYKSSLPNCKQLHRSYQASWEVFGNQITIQLAAQIEDNEYMAFGISGSKEKSQMLGADIAVAYYDKKLQRGFATDYNITALAPCVQVLGQWQGVCRDDVIGHLDSNQVFTAERNDRITVVTYRRTLQPFEPVDLEWSTSGPMYVVWAIGVLDHEREPTFHHIYPKQDVVIDLASKEPFNNCFAFSGTGSAPLVPWDVPELFDPALRVFTATLGPGGGRRGAGGRAGAAGGAPLVWYINGQLAPDLQMRRGLHYTFKVFGGNDPHSASLYHPLVVSASPRGAPDRLSEAAQRALAVLAGAVRTRRHRLAPTAAGPLCIAEHAAGADRRRDDDYASFRLYNRSLRWRCEPGAPADLPVQPNASWPDLVYYHSFTHAGMGGRIFIVDRHKRTIGKKSSASGLAPHAIVFVISLLAYLSL